MSRRLKIYRWNFSLKLSFCLSVFFLLFFCCFCFCLSALVIKMHQTLTEYLIQRFSFKNNKWVKVWSTTVTTSFVAVKAYVRRGPCSLYIPSAISTGALYLLLDWLIELLLTSPKTEKQDWHRLHHEVISLLNIS